MSSALNSSIEASGFKQRPGPGNPALAARLNPKLGLTCEHFFLVGRRHRSNKCSSNTSKTFRETLASTALSAIVGAWGFAVARPMASSADITGSLGRKSRKKQRRRTRPRGGFLSGSLSRQSRGCRSGVTIRQGAAGRGAERPRRSPCSNRPRSLIPTTRPCSPVTAERWRTMVISSKLSTFSAAPTPPTIRIGGYCRLKAPYSISSAGRGSPAVLCERAENLARRAFGAVQSRAFLRAFERSAEGGGDLAPRHMARPNADPRVRQNLALVVGLQGRVAEAETHHEGRSAGRGSGGGYRRSEAIVVA